MIIATKKITHSVGEELPMCSRSELDEVFIHSEWIYILPEGYTLFPTLPTKGDYILVVGLEDEQEIVIGYACPIKYVLSGIVYDTWEECCQSQYFHPLDYIGCRAENIEATINRQIQMMEDGCYGD